MKQLLQLSVKTILVTGASSGIGKSTAIQCANLGAKVILVGRNEERLAGTLNALEGDSHYYRTCDLQNDEELTALVSSLPTLDGVVFSAGINDKSIVKSISREKIDKMFNTNLFSPILMTKLLIKQKKLNTGASLVMVSSISATYATVSNALYASSKGALNSFIRVLALETAGKRIRVNGIMPGVINTPLLDAYAMKDELEALVKSVPLGRIGLPEDVANAVVYFLSDMSQWVTGTNLVVDGGITLR